MNKFIYFPALSNFEPKKWLINTPSLRNFYNTHPYFLISAGHNYQDQELREKLGLQNSLVMGDSGGYQISSGQLKYNDSIRYLIFEFLERNCDIGINLDIPPTPDKNFRYCLNQTYKNTQFFYENQSGKVKYLNTLHGNTIEEYNIWFDKMKDFDFYGWAIATKSLFHKVYCLLKILEIHDKSKHMYIHFLGEYQQKYFVLFQLLQNFFHENDYNITLTTDNSIPSRILTKNLQIDKFNICDLSLSLFDSKTPPEIMFKYNVQKYLDMVHKIQDLTQHHDMDLCANMIIELIKGRDVEQLVGELTEYIFLFDQKINI